MQRPWGRLGPVAHLCRGRPASGGLKSDLHQGVHRRSVGISEQGSLRASANGRASWLSRKPEPTGRLAACRGLGRGYGQEIRVVARTQQRRRDTCGLGPGRPSCISRFAFSRPMAASATVPGWVAGVNYPPPTREVDRQRYSAAPVAGATLRPAPRRVMAPATHTRAMPVNDRASGTSRQSPQPNPG